MKTRYIFGIILLASVSGTGCQKYLDITPKGQMIPSSTDDYRKILDYVGNKNSVGLQSTIYNTYGCANLLSDDYQVADSASFKTILSNKGVAINDRGDLFRWSKDGPIYTETAEDPDWLSLYGQIFIANTALDGLPKASGPEPAKKGLMAEARFHRAFCHLALVNIYAKHYTPAGAATDLGIPLRMDISLTAPLKRNTIKEVYDAVIGDLEAAIPDLPDIQKYSHRPNKAAACALLARAYLYMGKYDKSLENANLGLTITDFLYDFNTTLIRIPGDPLYNYFDQSITAWYDKELLCQKETCMVSGTYYRGYILSDAQTVNNLYDVVNDLRFFVKFGALSGAVYTYSEVQRRWGATIGYYPIVGVTVPEMILTRAESLARIGGANNLNAAVDELNKLRVKRYITGTYVNYVPANYSQAQIIQLVLDERRRELLGNGLRWFDLKRLNAIEKANITIQRNFTGDKLAPGDIHWVMPIAKKYIIQSPEIVQNEGYE